MAAIRSHLQGRKEQNFFCTYLYKYLAIFVERSALNIRGHNQKLFKFASSSNPRKNKETIANAKSAIDLEKLKKISAVTKSTTLHTLKTAPKGLI